MQATVTCFGFPFMRSILCSWANVLIVQVKPYGMFVKLDGMPFRQDALLPLRRITRDEKAPLGALQVREVCGPERVCALKGVAYEVSVASVQCFRTAPLGELSRPHPCLPAALHIPHFLVLSMARFRLISHELGLELGRH
jgi:hypothetical protein